MYKRHRPSTLEKEGGAETSHFTLLLTQQTNYCTAYPTHQIILFISFAIQSYRLQPILTRLYPIIDLGFQLKEANGMQQTLSLHRSALLITITVKNMEK